MVGAPTTATNDRSVITGDRDGPIAVIQAERMAALRFFSSMPREVASFNAALKNTTACDTEIITRKLDAIHMPGLLIIV